MTPRFDLIGMVAADMPATLAFYRSLGLDIPTTADAEGHVEVTLAGGIRLAWDSIEEMHSFDPDWQPATGGFGISTAFLVDSPAEVDSTHAAAVAAGYGVHKAPWDAFWGQRYATLIDPDGNHVDIFAPLPPS
jgi:uncharacterized glyoxalase superfamily protein PhnB